MTRQQRNFVPRDRAFGSLGLALKYLLLPEGKAELRKVIRYHAVDGLVYTFEIEHGTRFYKTLEVDRFCSAKRKGRIRRLALAVRPSVRVAILEKSTE